MAADRADNDAAWRGEKEEEEEEVELLMMMFNSPPMIGVLTSAT